MRIYGGTQWPPKSAIRNALSSTVETHFPLYETHFPLRNALSSTETHYFHYGTHFPLYETHFPLRNALSSTETQFGLGYGYT